mmetsp:Transcript_130/g.291  ORF Transcript_130/g.291 Transcript_130/m.291 type:complete len:244 (+) Transcript_130:40-771(+)
MENGSPLSDVLVWWTVPAPKPHPWDSEVIDSEEADLLREKLAHASGGVQVSLGKDIVGVAGCVRFRRASNTFRGFCELERMTDGKDYLELGKGSSSEILIVAKRDCFLAFLCRAWARNAAVSGVRPLLAHGACPFAEKGAVPLSSDAEIASHYLELLLGRGSKDKCPLAANYLQSVGRDMPLSEQPYWSSVLAGLCEPSESVLKILQTLDVPASPVPVDVREDMSLGVAQKVLELVKLTGLDL